MCCHNKKKVGLCFDKYKLTERLELYVKWLKLNEYVILLGSVKPGQQQQKIFSLDHISAFPITLRTHNCSPTATCRAWNILPSATISSHSLFWTGSTELVTWGDGFRLLTHTLTSRGKQPSGGRASASSAELMQHAWWDIQATRRARMTTKREQTSLKAIAARMQSKM